MKFKEAYEKLGYEVQDPRRPWTAENENGVCITLWEREIKFRNQLPAFDSVTDAGPPEFWVNDPKNKKRILQLKRAVEEFNGIVDVIIVRGQPSAGASAGCDPWLPDEDRQGARWHVISIDEEAGMFSVAVKPAESKN